MRDIVGFNLRGDSDEPARESLETCFLQLSN